MKQHKVSQEEQWIISLANEAVQRGDKQKARMWILRWMEIVGLIRIKPKQQRKDNNEDIR
jgi:hypothetical protein